MKQENERKNIHDIHQFIDSLPREKTALQSPKTTHHKAQQGNCTNENCSIVDTIGHTPLIELTKIKGNTKVQLFAKLESYNPGGSVKDRTAYHIVKKAEKCGTLTKGKKILEPTSGNTGIALAMIGAIKGYQVTLVMPSCVSSERKHILEAFGATIITTDGTEGTDGAIRKVHSLLE